MTIPAILNPQRDFSAGEIDISAIRRDDADVHKAAARKLLNCETILAGGFIRRPGMVLRFYGQPVMDRIEPVSGAIFDVEFRAGEFRARTQGGAVQVLVAPWNSDQLSRLDWALYDSKLIVVEQTMRPQVVEYNSESATWSIRDFAFAASTNGMLRQPFYRFAPKGVTMSRLKKDTGETGDSFFNLSGPSDDFPVLINQLMLGTEFRWVNRRLKLTAIVTSDRGTFENLEQLPPAFHVPVASTRGFRVGDLVQGATSDAQGVISTFVNPIATNMVIIITNGYAGPTNGEKLVGPESVTTISGATSEQTAIAFGTSIWDEAFMTDYRGWPGSVSVDRQRLIFCDFRQLPGAILESAIGQFDDFEIDAEDPAAAIFEISPQRERVRHVMGGADQFVFTVNSIYFIPVSAANPLVNGSIEFRSIGTGGCGDIKPVPSLSSLVYMSADNKRLMSLRQTGQTSQPYVLDHLSKYHSQLVKDPVDLVVSYGQDIDSGETIFLVNADGTITRGRYDSGADFVGFVPWNTAGKVKSAAALGRTVQFGVERALSNAQVVNTVETIDYGQMLDCAVATANRQGGLELVPFVGETLHRFVDGLYTGPVLIGLGGLVAGATGAAETFFGFTFTPHFKPFAPNFDKGQSAKQRLRRRKIKRYAISVQDTGPFKVNRTDLAGYRIGDDFGAPPPLVTDTFTGSVKGRSYDPTFDLTQVAPYPLKVVEVGMEVTS